jgi:hypothetical protein
MITSALLSLLLLRVVISLIKPKFIMRKHAGNGLSLQPEPAEPVHRV